MKTALAAMLTMQDKMNQKVHPQWIEQNYEWYRAIWIECGELIEHYGYKWWKKQQPDMAQVKLEVIDIWHFGMSALFDKDKSIETLLEQISSELADYDYQQCDIHTAVENLAEDTLRTKSFSVRLFWDLLNAAGMDFDELYKQYVGKNVLNFFRQDHGYKDGSYIKQWQGREDNEHLVEILDDLPSDRDDFVDKVYQNLADRYEAVSA